MTDFQKQKRAIESRELKIEQDKGALLFANGWIYTSSFPDSCWRWCKEIKSGRFTTTSADDALGLQLHLTRKDIDR